MANITRSLAHNTIIQMVGKILSTILGFTAIILLGRHLTLEEYGWYTTAISFLQFIAILIDFGLIPVTAQMLSEPTTDKHRLLYNILSFRFWTALIPLSLAPLIALLFPYPPEVKMAIGISAISFLVIALNQVLTGYFQTTLGMWRQVVSDLAARIILVVFLFALATAQASFISIMGALVVANICGTIILWFFANREIPLRFAYDFHTWKAIALKMWPIAISITCNVIYLRGDAIILPFFRAQTEVALYGMAYRVIDILSQTAMLVMGIFLPLLAFAWSRGQKQAFKDHFQRAFDASMLLAIPMTIGVMILATPIMTLVDEKYAPSGGPLMLLSLAVFGVYIGAMFSHTAVAMNKQKETLWIYASNAIMTIIGYLLFIPRFGMYGAAAMTVFSELYCGILLAIVVRRKMNEQVQLKTTGKICLSALGMAGVLYITPSLHVLVRTLFGVITYSTLIIASGAVSKETLKQVFSLKKGANEIQTPL